MSVTQTYQKALDNLKNKTVNKETIQQIELVEEVLEWNRKTLDFGIVAPGSKQDYSFTYLGTKKIKTVSSSCGCTSAVINAEGAKPKIEGVYSLPTDFSYSPTDLTPSSKIVTVFFEDKSTETLTVSCKVNRKYNIQ